MKRSDILNFLGSCVIAIAIVAAGCIIAGKLPETVQFPTNLNVSTQDGTQQFGDYLSIYEASAYLRISDLELKGLIESGELDSAVYKIGDSCLISRQALQDWADSKIGS